MQPHERLQRFWLQGAVAAETRAHDETEVAALEMRYGVELPADFRMYLLKSGPEKEVWDGANAWWPLSEIKSVAELEADFPLPSQAAQLMFADYLIWSRGWAIDCAPGTGFGQVTAIHGRLRNSVVAASFGEFVDLCIANDDRIAGGGM